MPDVLPTARAVRRAPLSDPPSDAVLLDFDQRLLRRRRLLTLKGEAILADLAETVSLEDGDALLLDDGRSVAVMAAEEDLMEVTGDLPRLAWHIGNRHAPCQIEGGRLVLRRDSVLRAMLLGLGAAVRDIREPFRPEGGAYGHGRTLGHSHAGHGGGADAFLAASGEGQAHAAAGAAAAHSVSVTHSTGPGASHTHVHTHVHRHRALRDEEDDAEPLPDL
jgi:urease accessory protein